MERIEITRPLLGPEEKAAVAEVMDSGKLWQGEKVAQFEEAFAKLVGVDFAIGVASGSAALTLALRALDLPPASTVHTSPFTYIATGGAPAQLGLKLSFSDISLASYNIDDDMVEAELGRHHSAIIPVHLYGLPAPMDLLLDMARRRKLRVVEDAAQAIGARYRGKHVGSLGDAGCFSFNAMKTVTTGEGGMVTTNDRQVLETVRAARDWGQRARYQFAMLGSNLRLHEVEAAMGIVQLRRLPESIAKRKENAAFYASALQGLQGVVLPIAPPGLDHAWYQYTLRVLSRKRDALRAHLDARGIETGVYYPQGLHEIGLFPDARHGKLGRCEMAAREVLSIPVHPGVARADRERVVAAIGEFYGVA